MINHDLDIEFVKNFNCMYKNAIDSTEKKLNRKYKNKKYKVCDEFYGVIHYIKILIHGNEMEMTAGIHVYYNNNTFSCYESTIFDVSKVYE